MTTCSVDLYSFVQMRGDPGLSFVRRMLAAFVQDEIAVRKNLSVSLGVRYDWLSFFGDDNNLAPRVSFAWAPGSKAGTVIRGGAGVFYDRTGEGPMADVLRSREGRLFRYVLLDPGYPDPLAPGSTLAESADQPCAARAGPGHSAHASGRLRHRTTGWQSDDLRRQLHGSTGIQPVSIP